MAAIRKLSSGDFQAVVRLKGMKPLYATFPTSSKAKQWVRMVEEDTSLARKLTRNELTQSQLVTDETTKGEKTHYRGWVAISCPSPKCYRKNFLQDRNR